MAEFYDTRQDLLDTFISENPSFNTWDSRLLYSTLVRGNPGLSKVVKEDAEPDFYTSDEVLSFMRERNPELAEGLSDHEFSLRLKEASPDFAEVWGLGELHEPLEERDPEAAVYDGWIGRRLEKPLSEYEDGQKLLELQRPQAESWLGRFWETFKGRGGRDWVPYGSEVMDSVELVGIANSYRKLLTEGTDENLSDEELLKLNLYVERMTRETEAGGWGMAGSSLRQSLLFMFEFGAYMAGTALAAANVFTGPADDVALHTSALGYAGKKAANKKLRSWLSRTLLSDAALDALQTKALKVGATKGGKILKRAYVGRAVRDGMKDTLTERFHRSLFHGAETKFARGASRFLGTQTINLGDALIKSAGKELAVGGATLAATGEFQTRRSLQMSMSDMLETGVPDDGDYRIAAYFDSVIEDYSEFLGDEILAALGGGVRLAGDKTGATRLAGDTSRKIGEKLRKLAQNGAKTAEEARTVQQRMAKAILDMHAAGKFGGLRSAHDMLKDVGYNGVFGEFMEERVGDMIRGLTGIEGEEDMNAFLRALDVGWNKTPDEWLAEAVTLITPMAASSVVRGGAQKLVEHSKGYEAVTRALGDLTGDEALHRSRRSDVRLLPVTPKTEEEAKKVAEYKDNWLSNLSSIEEIAKQESSGGELEARLASIQAMREQVESGGQDGYVLAQVRAGRDISTDGGPVSVEGPTLVLRPAPPISEEQRQESLRTGETDLASNAEVARQALELAHIAREKQSRSQGIVLDAVNGILDWAAGVKFMFAENRTFGTGAGVELTASEFEARQGAVDIVGKGQLAFERALAETPGFAKLRGRRSSELTDKEAQAYEDAVARAAAVAADQVMPMLNSYSGKVQLHAALTAAGWGDLVSQAGLDPKSLRSQVKARKMEKKVSELLANGVANGSIIRLPGGRMTLAPESKQQFLDELGVSGPEMSEERSLAEGLLEWRGIATRVVNAKEQAKLGESTIPGAMRAAGIPLPAGARVSRGNAPIFSGLVEEALAKARKARDTIRINILLGAQQMLHSYSRAYGVDVGFSIAELEQTKQPPSDQDTLAVRLVRQILDPNPQAPGFQQVMEDLGFPKTIGGERAFIEYAKRLGEILTKQLDGTLVTEGSLVVPAEDVDKDTAQLRVVTQVHLGGRFSIAEMDQNTGEAKVVVDSEGNPSVGEGGRVRYVGEEIASKGSYVRRVPRRVVFTRAPAFVFGTMKQMRAIGVQPGDLSDMKPYKKGVTSESDVHVVKLDGQASFDGKTLFLTYNEAAVAEEILESASKQKSPKLVAAVDGVAGFMVYKSFRAAVDDARERLRGQRRLSPAERRLLNAIDAKNPDTQARNIFELQGKAVKYSALGFSESVDRLGKKDADVFREEAETLVELTRDESGESQLLKDLVSFYQEALGGAEALDILRHRAGATVATPAEERGKKGAAPKKPAPKKLSALQKAEAELDAAIQSGDVARVAEANKKRRKAMRDAGMSDTSSTRTTAYERQMREEIRLANLAYQTAKSGGDQKQMRAASKLREQLQAYLREVTDLYKVSKSRNAVQYAAAKRTGYGTGQYEVTRAAVVEMLLPELQRSGVLTEAEVKSLVSRGSGYEAARTKLSEFFSRPFKYLTIGKMEGESLEVSEAMIDQLFGPLQYADGQLPPLPAPIGDRTGMTDEQLAAADQEFERATLMYDLSQANEVNQALDGDAREAESTSRLHEQIGRAILAERMGPYFAMHLDRMRTEGNVSGGRAFGLPLAQAGGAQNIAEAAKKSDALAAESPIYNETNWKKFQEADVSGWESWEKDFHDVAKRLPLRVARMLWPSWFGRQFQELLLADMHNVSYEIGPDGRVFDAKMLGSVSPVTGLPDGQAGMVIGTLQVHVANKVRTREGLSAFTTALGHLCGNYTRALPSGRVNKSQFMQWLERPGSAANIQMPTSPWARYKDGSVIKTPASGGKDEATSLARSFKFLGNLIKAAYAEQGLSRFVPWAGATRAERIALIEGSDWLKDVVDRAAKGEKLSASEIANAAAEYDKVMRAAEAAAFFLKDLYIALVGISTKVGRGPSYNYELARSTVYSAISSARVRVSDKQEDARDVVHENNAGIALAHLGSLVKESSRSTGLGSKPLVLNQRQMEFFNLAEAARAAGILRKGPGTGVALIDMKADAFKGSLSIVRPNGSVDGYGRATPLDKRGNQQPRREFHEGPDDQTPQMQYIAMLMTTRFGRRGEGGFYAYPLPMGDKKRQPALLLDADSVEAEARKIVAEEFPNLATSKGALRLDALFTAMDRMVAPLLSMEGSLGAESKKLTTSLKAMVKRLRLLSTSGDLLPITENGMKSTYDVFVAEEIYLEQAGKDGKLVRTAIPGDPFDGGAGATAKMLLELDDSRGRLPGETHSVKLQETGSALYKGNATSGEAAMRTEAILKSLKLGGINPLFAGLTELAEKSGSRMWTTPGAEKAYNKAEGFWPAVKEARTEVTLPDGTKATLVVSGRTVTHWTQSTLEVANLVRQAAPSSKDTTVSVPYNVSQGFEEQRERAKTLFELDELQARIAAGLYSTDDALAKATERAKSRDDYIGGMLDRGMSIRDPHALADVTPSLLSSAGSIFYTSAPTITAQLVPSGETLGDVAGGYRNPFLAPPGEKDGRTTAGLAMVNNIDPRARYLWQVAEADLEAVKAAIVQLARDPANTEASAVLQEKVRDYFGQKTTGREAVDDLVLDDFSFDEDAVRTTYGKTYIAGTAFIGYRIPGGKDGMAAGFFRLSLPATLDYDADGRVVPGRENYAMISGRSAGQRGEDFDGDMLYSKIAQRETATLDELAAEYAKATEAKDDKALAVLEKQISRAMNAEHVRALRGMTLAQATAIIDKTVLDRVVAADGRTVGEHSEVGVTFDPKQPYLRGGRGLAAVGAKDDAQLKGVAVSAADAVSMLSLYEVLRKFEHEDLDTYFQRLNILQRLFSNVVNIALDVVNEPRAAALHLTPKTLPLFVAFMVSQKIDPAAELDPAKQGDPKAKGTVAWAAQRWLELAESVDMGAYEAFAENLPRFEMDNLLGEQTEAPFVETMTKVAARMLEVGRKIKEQGQPIDLAKWNKPVSKENLRRIWGIARFASNIHRRGRISKIADRGFSTVFDVMAMRKDLESERKASEGFETDPPFLRAQAAVDTAIRTLRAAYGDNTMDLILALDPKSRRLFDTAVDGLLSDKAATAVEAAYAEGLESLGIAPEWRSRAAQAVVEKIISDPRMADSDFANSISAEPGRKGQPRIKYVAPRTPPAIAQKAADEFFGRVASLGPVEIEVDGKPVRVPAEMVPALIALQQIEEHGVGPARFKGGIYHFLPATFQAEVAKQFEGELEAAPVEAPVEAPPVEPPTGPTYSEFLARLPKAVRKQMQRSLDAMGPDIAAMMGAERMSQDRIREELQIARSIADEMDDAEVGLLLGALETELLGEKPPAPKGRVARVVAPRQVPGEADSGPGTKKGTGADQMMRDATLAAKVSAGVFVARGPELLRSSRTSALTIAAKLGETVRSIGGSTYVVSPMGADFASASRRYAPGEAVAMIAGNTGTRLTDEAKASIQRLNDAGFEFVVGSMPEHTDSDAREFILSIGGKVTVYDWGNRYQVPAETAEQEDGVKYPVSDLFEALGGEAGRLVTDHGLYGTEVLADSAADGRRIADELVDATEMSDEEKAVVKDALAKVVPAGWDTSATRDIPIEAQVLETSSTRFDLEGALDPIVRSMRRAEELKKLHAKRPFALSMPDSWGERNSLLTYEKSADGTWQVYQPKFDEEGNPKVDEDTAAPITEAEVKAAWAEEQKVRTATFEIGNRDFAAIAESVEQWKREQGIVYDPKEAHAVGEAFYHDVGAFNREAPGLLGKIASVLLAQQRKLRRGERDWWKDTENQLVVSGYTARQFTPMPDTFTKPIDDGTRWVFSNEAGQWYIARETKNDSGLWSQESREKFDADQVRVFWEAQAPFGTQKAPVRPGRGMRFVVNPSSRDIVWAAVGDAYSGTVVKSPSGFAVTRINYASQEAGVTEADIGRYAVVASDGSVVFKADTSEAARAFIAENTREKVAVDPKAPSADKLGLIADSVATAIQGRRPQNYNEIGVRLRLGNFYIEDGSFMRDRVADHPMPDSWEHPTQPGISYYKNEAGQWFVEYAPEFLPEENVTEPGGEKEISESQAKAAWRRVVEGESSLPTELRRLNELLKKAYSIVHGSLDPMAAKRKGYDTSATRQAILDNGRETLYQLAYELTPRRNDAGAADRIRNRMLRELDADNAASRRAARAQVLDDIRTASKKNPRFQYDGAIGPIREFVRQLEQADSLLADTTTEAPTPKAAPAATQMTLPGVDTSATRVASVDADGTVNLAFTGEVKAKAESNFQKKYWTLEKALQESGFKKPEIDFIKSVSPSPASLAEAVQAAEEWMKGQMNIATRSIPMALWMRPEAVPPGYNHAEQRKLWGAEKDRRMAALDTQGLSAAQLDELNRRVGDEMMEENAQALRSRPYQNFSVNRGQGEYREYMIRGKFPVPGQHGEFQDPNLAGWFRVREYRGVEDNQVVYQGRELPRMETNAFGQTWYGATLPNGESVLVNTLEQDSVGGAHHTAGGIYAWAVVPRKMFDDILAKRLSPSAIPESLWKDRGAEASPMFVGAVRRADEDPLAGGTLEIQEIQSELFQKNKGGFEVADKASLNSFVDGRVRYHRLRSGAWGVIPPGETTPIPESMLRVQAAAERAGIDPTRLFEESQQAQKFAPEQADFLNLMLKNQTWVPVFVNAITQWAKNQGFTKVRFPTGETAARVEGHQVLADRLMALQEERDEAAAKAPLRFYVSRSRASGYDGFQTRAEADIAASERRTIVIPAEKMARGRSLSAIDAEIQNLKTQGIEKLAPIEAFYERRVAAIVNRMGAQLVTDANGNTWREVDTSATRELSERQKIFDDMGLKPGLDYTADPGEMPGASEQTPLLATKTLRYHRSLEAEGVPVQTFLEDPAAARMVAAFDGHDVSPTVAASLSTFVFDRDYRRAERALELSDLPESLKERVSGAIRDAKEAQDTGHKNAFEIGYDPETQPLDVRIDPIGEDDFDFRANELTSSTRTIDAIIRERIAFMIEYGGSQRAHQILRDTAYYVNAERKLLSNFNLRMRSIFFEDAGITHFIRSIDSEDVDPDTGLHKKEYLRGLRNRIMHHTTRVELSVQDRNMLTRLFAAIDALIEGDEFAVYGGKIRRIDDPTTGEQGKLAPQVATRLDQDGAPIGEIEPVEKILSDFETSGLREKYLANGRTEADLDIRALAETIKKYYSDMRTRLNNQAFALLGREYLDEVANYVPHQYGGRGFEDSFQRAAWRAVSWQAENIGRRTGSRAPLPPLAFDASKKSFKHDILPEQVELVKKLAAERDNLMSEALGRPVHQAARALKRLAGADLRGANRVILQLVREVESIKAEQAEREAGEGVESTYKMAPETADLISGLSHASRNYAVKEWTERAEERVYDSYFQAYMESEGLLARRSMDPFTRLRRYVDDVTSAMSQQMITQIFSLAPVQTEDGFTPAVIAVPDMARLSEMPSNRRVVSESVAKAQVAFISMEQNIKDVPGETAFHQLKWLIDNGYLKSKDYVEVQSPYASTEKFLVIKGRPRQLLLKHLAVDPQLIFRLTPGGVQHDAVKLVTNIVQFTKHAAVSWSMFFVFAGVEAVIALGGLSKHNIVAKAPSALKQLRDLRRDVRRGDAALDDVIYRMHRAGIDMSEHAVSDGSTTIVENMSKRVSENFARWVGKPGLAAQAKPAIDFMTGRWASKKIMGDFFPLVKFWGGLEIIEGMRREAPGVPLDTIYRKAAPNVNNAFGGQMFVDYPGMTPFWTKFLNMGMFAVNWSVSAWNIAGGQKLTGHRFGNYLTPEGERFVFLRNWPAMYFLVLLALPNALQLGIRAVAMAAGGGDDEDDRWLASMNEAGKGGLFPSIDVTPIMRELPGYTGGHTGERRVYIRFGKQSYEVLNGWLENPKRTFLRKTSMPFKLIWEQTFESSPGSPEFSLPFKDMGFAGLFSSRVDGNPFLKLWNSRVGFAAQKFLPLSWNTLVQGDMESWAFIGTAPMSKGMAQTRAIPPMARLLETYAETESFGRLKTSAAARANLERMTWSYLRALERNGYDPDSILVSAKGLVMRKYYRDFFDGMTRNDQATMDKAARALIRLNGTARNLVASVASRYKKKYKTKLSPDQRAALMDAFEGLRVPFQKGPPE